MNDEQYLATLVKGIAPDNGVEFLSAVIATLHDEYMLKRIVHLLEMETIEAMHKQEGNK